MRKSMPALDRLLERHEAGVHGGADLRHAAVVGDLQAVEGAGKSLNAARRVRLSQ
jgi:hypothetical protein